ncbi:MAG TPA: pyruvate phosphate dikinase, partial [Vicinamibacteria bacterium]
MGRTGVRTGLLVLVTIALPPAAAPVAPSAEEAAERRAWIVEMKGAERGPFSRIRWFCKDGALLPPTPSACASHGGGWQHGEWSARTTALRAQGYQVANVLAGVDVEALAADPGFPESYAQILVERFLVGADNGWIYRRAQYYRGAVQAEDERDGARALLLKMLEGPEWVGYRYPALRAGARLLPHGKDGASIQRVRDMSSALAVLDPAFARLRAKIHGTPEARDAASVREHSTRSSRADLAAQYEALAAQIDLVYSGPPLPERLEQDALVMSRAPWLQRTLREGARRVASAPSPASRYSALASLLADLRDALPRVASASARLRVLDLSLAGEAEAFRAGAEIRDALGAMTRAERLALVRAAGDAAYGTGHLNGRLRSELAKD